jgi:RimJ/RimL family protein N-acetyltransferase
MAEIHTGEITPTHWLQWQQQRFPDRDATLPDPFARPGDALAWDSLGRYLALLHAEAFDTREWMLQIHWIAPHIKDTSLEATALTELVRFWTPRIAQPGRLLTFRLRAVATMDSLRRALSELGYVHANTRVEFRTPLADLPAEGETRLVWKPALEAVATRSEVAGIMDALRIGDTSFGPEDASADILSYYYQAMDDAAFNQHVHVGLRDGQPVAMVLLEVAPRRDNTPLLLIPWMGLAPAARGQGLGGEVHRHGFAMFRALTPVGDYYGGTLTGNLAMQRLFERHHCQPYQRLEEWVFKAP